MKNKIQNFRSLVLNYVLGGLAIALTLWSCDTQVAGSSVGTGNPTEIKIGFTQDGAATAITGTMDVYASTQIPVPGFSPNPILSIPVTSAKDATVSAQALAAMADSLWPSTSIEGDTLYHFNLVVSGATQGTILKSFGLRKGKKDFVPRVEDAGAKKVGDGLEIGAALTALVEVKAVIDSTALSPTRDDYLFLYGTGYTAKGISGQFKFVGLPKGDYETYLLSLPRKDGNASGEDTLYVYGLKSQVHTDSDNLLTVGTVTGSVPLPESLKIK